MIGTILATSVLAFGVGTLLGLLGAGGSILTVPIFAFVLGFPPKVAIASSLLVVGLTSAVATFSHHLLHNVQWRVAFTFGSSALVASYLSARLSHYLSGELQMLVFALVMLGAATAMIRSRHKEPRGQLSQSPIPLLLQGFAVGVLTGLVGVGGGFLIVPALTLLSGLRVKNAIGTSLAIITLNCAAGFLGYAGQFEVPWLEVVVFVVASTLGTFVGARGVGKVSPAALKKGFAILLIAIALLILYRTLPELLWYDRISQSP